MKIGTQELLIVLAIAILIFGPTQIPKLSKILGKSIKNFRSGMSSDDEEEKDTTEA
ncbi:MAG: twin-arginine translocase TatA/TatE family subunit [Lachnospiraceae bacterium]|nr:twin-arginine translocase TatA/TatE family subunit [Lachnospiraceae bacterium]